MKKILYTKQTDMRDCGVSCLMSIIRYYNGYASREYLRDITKTTKDGVSVYSLIEAGSNLGFEVKAIKSSIKEIEKNLPCIAHLLIKKKYGHFVIICKVNSNNITIMDPDGGFKKLTHDEFNQISTNVYLLFKPKCELLKQSKGKSFFEFLYPIIKKFKLTLIILFIFSLIYAACNILISYEFQFFLDLINSNANTIKLVFYFLLFVLFLKELTNLFRNNLINFLNHKLDKSLLTEVYNHIIRLPYLYFKNRAKGDIVTRIQDILTIREVISKLLVTVIIDLVFVIIGLIFLFKINLKLTIISLIIIIYNFKMTKKMKVLKDEEANINNYLIETISSINTIKGMQLENYLNDKLKINYDSYQNISFDLTKKYHTEIFIKELIYGIGLLTIIYLGFNEVIIGTFSLGSLLVFNSLISYFFTPIQNICNLQVLIKEAYISFLRIKELLNIEREKIELDTKCINKHLKGTIEINNLKYSYNGINDILICEKLKIRGGQKVLLYGTSGGGKSTLMRLLCRYLDNSGNSILIDNKSIDNYNLLEFRNRITYLSQDEVLYTDTIYNNIVLKEKIDDSEYQQIIKITGVNKIFEKSLLKDNMLLDNNASNLSGGEKQRVLLARALVKRSDIYIFDESFSALDIKNERILIKNIFEYLKNRTVIVISHRFNNRDLYQKFVLIQEGVVYEY